MEFFCDTQERVDLASNRSAKTCKYKLMMSTGVTIGVYWGAYLVTQNSAKNAQKHAILTPKIQKFSGEEAVHH